MSTPEAPDAGGIKLKPPPSGAIKLKPPPGMPTTPSAPPDVENQAPPTTTTTKNAVSSIVNRWKREDLLKRGSLILRGAGLVFSLLAMIVMASNKHGGWMNFDNYEEYRYLLAISILAFLYTAGQIGRHIHRLSSGNDVISLEFSGYADFLGDQVVAYLLMSSLSAAAALTTNMREGADNMFTDSSAAAISMAFFAFLSLALSALISGFKLSNRSYI